MRSNLSANISLLYQLNDWDTLEKYTVKDIQNDKQSNQLALMIMVALFQVNRVDEAKAMLLWAQDRNASLEQCTKYLLASANFTLATVKLLQGETERSQAYIEKASLLLTPEIINTQALLDARTQAISRTVAIKTIPYTSEVLNVIDLGKAWSGNSINTVIFRHHAVLSRENWQYTAYYVDDKTLRVIKRNLANNDLMVSDILGEYNLRDAHNSISLGMDRLGFIHISYDHHIGNLNYRRSMSPHSIEEWSEQLPMTGLNEENVTYPTFIESKTGSPLLMLYRDGNAQKGNAHLKYYDEELETWFDYDNVVFNGSEQHPWTANAYWNHPVSDEQDILHFSYTWRLGHIGEDRLVNNIDIDYAKSFDRGMTWYTSQNQPYALPITPTTSETIWPISPGSNHINQTSMAIDSWGNPHIAFYVNDDNHVPQYYHLWSDGSSWKTTQISNRIDAFALKGGGTLKIPISRPEIVVDEDDTVFIVFRSQESEQRLVAVYLTAPEYQYQEKNLLVLWNEPVGQAEPIIDRTRWDREKILSLLIQYNEQPNADINHEDIESEIKLVDIKLKKHNAIIQTTKK